MPIHWSYKSLPEISGLSDAERKDVWKKATDQAYGQWQTLLAMLIVCVPIPFVADPLGSMFGSYFLGLVVAAGIACVASERIVFQITRSHLRKIIARTDKG
jgi:hypothetical protein